MSAIKWCIIQSILLHDSCNISITRQLCTCPGPASGGPFLWCGLSGLSGSTSISGLQIDILRGGQDIGWSGGVSWVIGGVMAGSALGACPLTGWLIHGGSHNS
eukprot:819469-Pelagomonas_calceolata.AAC.1